MWGLYKQLGKYYFELRVLIVLPLSVSVRLFLDSENSYTLSCGVPVQLSKAPLKRNATTGLPTCAGTVKQTHVLKEIKNCFNFLISYRRFPLLKENIFFANSINYILHMSFVSLFDCCCFFCFFLLFWSSLNADSMAPPVKQKARFKIKDAKCHLRPRNKEKQREASRPSLQGATKPVLISIKIRFTVIHLF